MFFCVCFVSCLCLQLFVIFFSTDFMIFILEQTDNFSHVAQELELLALILSQW